MRRGYDPDEVDRHLREIADAVDELKVSRRATRDAPVAAAAAGQVQAILEAAERGAAEIRTQADREAERTISEAEADAGRARARGEAEAATHVQEIQEATRRLVERAGRLEADLSQLGQNLRTGVESLVEDVRTVAGSVSSDLEEIRSAESEIRGSAAATQGDWGRSEPAAAHAEPTDAPVGAAAEAVEPQETSAEAAYEATPEGEDHTGGRQPGEGARLIALNMALNGSPREETARYLDENFDLPNRDAILDEAYRSAG